MSLTGRELIVAALLALLGAAAWWYSASIAPEPDRVPETVRRPDYVIEDLVGVTMAPNGRPARRLETPQLRHYPVDDSRELDTPRILIFDDDAPPWVIRSERGWVSADGDEALLEGAVRAERDAAPNLEPMVLTTSELLLLPDSDYAETDRFAELERGNEWVSANDGMQVWFGEPMRIRLFGRTHMRIAPNDSAP
jgi:lipopolysaccharide export system protein LptC